MDILHRLGLTAQSSRETFYESTSFSSTSSLTSTTSPPSHPLPGAGVVLDPDSHYEAPAGGLFPPEIGEEFSVVVSLSSWRANNAFLFSVRDGRDRLRFGVQLLPRRVVVYTAEKASVYFNYDWQVGHQYSFAVGVRPRSVSFYADCGAVHQREQILARPLTLGGSGGLLTLGRMNSKAAAFQGRVCQLDIYPSAQAAARYCNFLKKQCRLADTFRSPPSPPHSLDMEANDPPSYEPSVEPHPTHAAETHNPQTPTMRRTAPNPSPKSLIPQYSTLSPSVQPHLGDRTHITLLDPITHSNPPSLQPDSPASATLSGLSDLGIARRTTSTPGPAGATRYSQGAVVQSDNDTEEESSPRRPRTTDATPSLISPVRQSRLKEGLRNSSSSGDFNLRPHPTDRLLESMLKINGTTLYRENQVDASEERGMDGSYDDVDMGGYDYGYEEPEYFYDYEGGFTGPKGEPGPPVR